MKKLLIALLLMLSPFMVSPAQAVVSSTSSKVVYAGTGSDATFAFTFNIYATTDLSVSLINIATGAITPLTLNSDYTVTPTHAYPSPGSITLTAGVLSTAYDVAILRLLPFTQLISLSDNSATPAATFQEGYDRATMLAQQLQEQLNRAFLAPLGSTYSVNQLTFPSPVAYGYIGWDATATYLQNYVLQGLATTSSPEFAGLKVGTLAGLLKGTAGTVGVALADVDYSTPGGAETFTNKTYDTAGTGNVFKINGTQFTGSTVGTGNIVLGTSLSGNSGKVAQSSGTLTSGHCAKFDSNGNIVDDGAACGGSGASLTGAISGTSNQVTVSSNTNSVGENITLSLPQSIATSSSPTFGGLTLSAGNIVTDTTTGTKIGTGTTQKLGFYNSTPIAKPTGNISTALSNLGLVASPSIAQADVTGLTTASSPVFAGATIGSLTGILKASSGVVSAATSAVDYAPATSGSNILYGNGAGGFANVTIGTGVSFTGGTLSAANGSSTLFQYHGQIDTLGSSVGEYVGSNLTPNASTGNYRFLQNLAATGNYATIWTSSWIKLAGVNTITVRARIWAYGGGHPGIKVDVGGQNGNVTGTMTTTPGWVTFTINVSSLTNGTVYDVTASMTSDVGLGTQVYCSDIIGFGS